VGCLESIKPFWISREPFTRPWCNLAASQGKPCCASVNSHSRVGLFSRQWDAIDWACVLCDRRIHNDRASRSTSTRQCTCPFYSSRTGFCQSIASPRSVSPPTVYIWLFPNLNRHSKGGDLWMRRPHCTQAQSTASHCPITSPKGKWLFTDVQ